uniref:G_PROTEIN_RECEP_F1_2 domain-containing protein n=1 Tax=Rhabditophanes sp. KR3021 TaxID=114890 RepID=A0AC35TLV7_9BILA
MENDIYSTVKNFDYDFMGGNNCSNSPWPSCLTIGKAMITIAFLLVVMLVIVLGNTLVVLTVYNDHKLRTQRQNWLIVSLAIADLLVGLIVMPLTTAYEIIGAWRFGEILCEIWLALDVLFVTASILHICIISLDRYWSVTQPLEYPSKRTPFRMSMMIGIAWIVSFLICIPPLFGWRPERDKEECGVSTDLGYVLYSSLGSFYIPVIILVIVYWKIYSITKNHSRQRLKEHERTDKTLIQFQDSKKTNAANTVKTIESPEGNPDSDKHSPDSEHEPVNSTSISKVIPPVGESEKGTKKWRFNLISNKKGEKMYVTMDKHSELRQDFNQCNNAGKRKRLLKAKERQATLLLGLILTAFIASWLPFFVMYVMQAFGVIVPNIIFKFFFWLGYCNSGINPVIYTLFNREFKRALNRQLKRYSQSLSAMKEGCLLRC